MVPRRVFKSLGAVVIPAAILLNACPPPTSTAGHHHHHCCPDHHGQGHDHHRQATTTTARATTTTARATTTTVRATTTTARPTTTTASTDHGATTGDRLAVRGHVRHGRRLLQPLPTRSSSTRQRPLVDPQWQGDHNMGCEGPTTQRTVHSDGAHDSELFWWCAPGDPTKVT